MNILVTGASGLLGRYLLKTAPRSVLGTFWNHSFNDDRHVIGRLRIHDPAMVDTMIEALRPDVIIHAAGIGDVDQCQKNPSGSRMVNVNGTEMLAKAAKRYGCKKFVYLSTNAVFQGDNAPYAELDFLDPVNEYGKQKVEAEYVVKRAMEGKTLIIRPIMLYGWPRRGGRDNWGARIYGLLTSGKQIRMVNDIVTQPTYAGDVANVIWSLIDKDATGVYHVGGLSLCTLHSFANVAADVFGLDGDLISPAASEDFPTLAPRPKNTTYRLDKLYSTGVIAPSGTKDGLVRMRDERIYHV